MAADSLTSRSVASALEVSLTADGVAPPRLVYGGLDLQSADGSDQAYTAVYFDVAGGDALGRVTFEGLDAIRGSRGEDPPFQTTRPLRPADWVFEVDRSAWLKERHSYEMRYYATPLSDTHRHYLFRFHDEFVEAIAEGIWLDRANRSDPFAPPASHPLNPFDLDLPCERFTSDAGIEWELRRSPRSNSDLIYGSRYCSQRVFQLNLPLDGGNREAASIWIRTVNGVLVSRMRHPWAREIGRREGFAQPADFAEQWKTYLEEVAQRRPQMGR